jgi:hypothetical protein
LYQGGHSVLGKPTRGKHDALRLYTRTVRGARHLLLAAQMALNSKVSPGGPQDAVQYLLKVVEFPRARRKGESFDTPRFLPLGEALIPVGGSSEEDGRRYNDFVDGLAEGLAAVVRDETPGGLAYTHYEADSARRYKHWIRRTNHRLGLFVRSLKGVHRRGLPELDDTSPLGRVYVGCLAVIEIAFRAAEERVAAHKVVAAGGKDVSWSYPAKARNESGPFDGVDVARRAVLGAFQRYSNRPLEETVNRRLSFEAGLSDGVSTGLAGLFMLVSVLLTGAMLLEADFEVRKPLKVEDPMEKMGE